MDQDVPKSSPDKHWILLLSTNLTNHSIRAPRFVNRKPLLNIHCDLKKAYQAKQMEQQRAVMQAERKRILDAKDDEGI